MTHISPHASNRSNLSYWIPNTRNPYCHKLPQEAQLPSFAHLYTKEKVAIITSQSPYTQSTSSLYFHLLASSMYSISTQSFSIWWHSIIRLIYEYITAASITFILDRYCLTLVFQWAFSDECLSTATSLSTSILSTLSFTQSIHLPSKTAQCAILILISS